MARIDDNMTYEYLRTLRGTNAAWRLLTADQAAFLASFFHREFLAKKQRGIPAGVLMEHLEEYLEQLRQDYPEDEFSRSAREYLELWTDARYGWLRKYHYQDEWHYDLTASAQKAVEWLMRLRRQEFIGTESRLHTVFQLLGEIVRDSDTDPRTRREWLEQQKAEIESELAELEGVEEIKPRLDDVQIKERFLQAESTAESILSDFREVEENFRMLQRQIQEDIVTWTQGKGELLDRIFAKSDEIHSSEQGRSFQAFWSYLMASQQQDAFQDLLDRIRRIASLQETLEHHPMDSINFDWVRAASAVQETLREISSQLRRYVDEGYLREERYIHRLIRQVESRAMAVRDSFPKGVVMTMDETAPDLQFPMERPLFIPAKRTRREDRVLEAGSAPGGNLEVLVRQEHIDPNRLRQNIDVMLKERPEVTLQEVLERFPLQYGLMELLGYLVLAGREEGEAFRENDWGEILFDHDGRKLRVRCERTVYRRKG